MSAGARPLLSAAATVAAVAALSAAVFGGTLGLLALLPARTDGEKLAVEAIELLAAREEVRTSVQTPDGTFRAGCRVLPRRREQFTALDGRQLLIEGPYARERIGGPNLPATDLQQAFLAGCPRLISRNVGRRIRRGAEVYGGEVLFGNARAHELIVMGPRTEIRLFVDRDTLEPLGVKLGRLNFATFLP